MDQYSRGNWRGLVKFNNRTIRMFFPIWMERRFKHSWVQDKLNREVYNPPGLYHNIKRGFNNDIRRDKPVIRIHDLQPGQKKNRRNFSVQFNLGCVNCVFTNKREIGFHYVGGDIPD